MSEETMSSASSTTTTLTHDKFTKKLCCGIKVRKFSVRRLRTKFLYIFRLLRRWRNSYRHAFRQLRKLNLGPRKHCKKKDRDKAAAGIHEYAYLYANTYGIRSMRHSNSFCSEAIADCLEFIKRNSVSLDDEHKPMLKQD